MNLLVLKNESSYAIMSVWTEESIVCNRKIFALLSKSARRKKREEAEKVPEVSKEIYYDVFCDLKAVFGQKKDGKPEEEEKMNWDQNVEAEAEEEFPESSRPADTTVAERESSGFHFSFFGDDAETGGAEAGGSALLPASRQISLFHSSETYPSLCL